MANNGPRGSAAKSNSGQALQVNTAPGSPHWGGGADIEEQFVTPFMQKHGLTPGSGKRTPAKNASIGGSPTSDHLTTNTTSSARDYPTFTGEGIASSLAEAMGNGSWQANSYDSFDIAIDGFAFRVQILWGASIDHDDHIHVGIAYSGKTNAPDTFDGSVTVGGGGPTSGDGAGDLGSFSEEDLFAIARASAVSTMFELPGLLNATESLYMTGAKSIYNDEPLMPFVQELCKSSMRTFQSLPNGAFFAFFPDPFGLYGHRKPYWNIDNIEVIEGGIDLNDDTLATHVFVVGDTGPSFQPDGQITLPEKINSKGVVTIYDAFMSEHMIARGAELDKADPDEKKFTKLGGYSEAQQFLRKYGVRPHYEPAPFIRNSFFEIFYAYTQFQTLWASQYRTQFTFTYMPELYPGGVVAFEEHGIRCYVDSVTHDFNYESGFSTTANLSAPAALNKSDSPIAAGMVLPFFGTKRKDDRPKLPPPDHPKVEHPHG